MIKSINLTVSDFYSLKGRLGRLDFFWGLVTITVVIVIAHYTVLQVFSSSVDFDMLLMFLVLMQFFSLSAATPFYVKRLHDLNSSGWWASAFWLVFPFSPEMAALIKRTLEIHINPFFEPAMWLALITLVGSIVLLFKKGNPEDNQWGSPRNSVLIEIE